MNQYVLWGLEWLALTVVTFVSTMCMSEEMTKRGFRFPRWFPFAVSEGCLVVLFLLGRFSAWTLCGCALSQILLFASIEDYSTHEADNVLSVMIFLLGLSAVTEDTVLFRLLGAGIVCLAQLLVCGMKKKAGIGGADVKISAAAVFLLGFYRGIIGFTFGLLLAIVVELIRNRKSKQSITKPFPLVPYLSVGLMIGYLL